MSNKVLDIIVAFGSEVKDFLKGTSEVAKGLQKAREQAGELATQTSKQAKKMSVAFTGAGLAIAGSLTYAAVGAAEVDKAFAEVTTLISDLPVEKLDELRVGADRIAEAFGEDATVAIQGMYDAISAGVEPTKVLGFLETAAIGAKAGVSDLSTAVDLGTSVLNAYGMEADQLEEVMDTTFATVKAGKTTFDEIASSIGGIAPLAASTGVSFEELGAAMATSTAAGINTSQSATGLKAVLSNIAKPTTAATDAAYSMGIEFNTAALKAKGLVPFLAEIRQKAEELSESGEGLIVIDEAKVQKQQRKIEKLTEKLSELQNKMSSKGATESLRNQIKGVTEDLDIANKELLSLKEGEQVAVDATSIMTQLFGSIEGANLVLGITSEGSKKLTDNLELMNNKAGASSEAFNAIVENDPTFIFSQITSGLERLRTQFGRAVTDYILPFAESFRDIISRVNEFLAQNPELVAFVTSFLAGLSALLLALGGISGIIAIISGGIAALLAIGLPTIGIVAGVIIPAILAVVAALGVLYFAFEPILNFLREQIPPLLEQFKQGLAQVKEAIIPVIEQIKNELQPVFEKIFGFIGEQTPGIQGLIQTFFNWIANVGVPAVAQAISFLISVFNWLVDFYIGVFPSASQLFVSAMELVKNIFYAVWQAAGVLFDALGYVFQMFTGGEADSAVDWADLFLKSLNFIVDTISKLLKFLGDMIGKFRELVSILDSGNFSDLVGFAKNTFGIGGGSSQSEIPALADGGIVKRPTLALIGEAGPEAVIPLKNGSVPVSDGSVGGSGVGDNLTFNIYPSQGMNEEQLAEKVGDVLRRRRF